MDALNQPSFYQHAREKCIFYGKYLTGSGAKQRAKCSALTNYMCHKEGRCPFFKSSDDYEIYIEYDVDGLPLCDASHRPLPFLRHKL